MNIPATHTPRRRRSVRDWLVDFGLFVLAVMFGLMVTAEREPTVPDTIPAWAFDLDQIVGALACVAVWLRRRWPVGLAVVLVALSALSELVSGAMLVALLSVAVHRRPRVTAVVFAGSLVSAFVYTVVRPEPDMPWLMVFLFGSSIQAAMVGWGLFIHHRRQLVLSLRDRAQRAEAEAELRARQAQRDARDAIAREIHDVLGHRLSLLSVHAGALEYRLDADREAVARAAAVIRENSHQALQDLREVIGVLRAPTSELPQPTMDDIPRLIEESTQAGMLVEARTDVPAAIPEQLGRTIYRIVQEGLTNARKHAPGASVNIAIAREADEAVTIEVVNGPGASVPIAVTGTGQGLIGLAERAALAGGRIESGPAPDQGWRLNAWIPWPP